MTLKWSLLAFAENECTAQHVQDPLLLVETCLLKTVFIKIKTIVTIFCMPD